MRDSTRGLALATCTAVLLLVVASAASASDAPTADGAPQPTRAVDINAASVAELTEVPGIGEVMAQRIVDWREEYGPFRRVEDLMKVKGIGEKSLEKMRSHVTVAKSD